MNESGSRELRVAKNTLILFLRLLFTMAISLYTSRVVLNVLGVDDFGIYNVVAGFLIIFTVLSDSLSSSISRFITLALGNDDLSQQKKVFSTSVNVEVLLSIFLVIFIEIIGIWFINYKMNVPQERFNVLFPVFQLSVVAFVCNMLKGAFTSLIFAHEHASAFAWLAIIEAFLKLTAVLCLAHSTYDKLVFYVFLLLIISFFVMLLTLIYCLRNFDECSYSYHLDLFLIRQMFNFSGWVLLGRGAWVVCSQGLNLLMNVFFGVAVNAARGIAYQVDTATQQFVNNLMIAITPQIIKAYANNEAEYMNRLVNMGAKYSGFIILLYTIPLLCETENVLQLWLGVVPDYAVIFTRLSLLSTLFFIIPQTLNTALQATGRIRNVQAITSMVLLLVLPVSYYAYYMGFSPVVGYIFMILANVLIIFIFLYYVKKYIGIHMVYYMKEVLAKILLVFAVSIVLPMWVSINVESSFFRLTIVFLMSFLLTSLSIYIIGMKRTERNFIVNYIRTKIKNNESH